MAPCTSYTGLVKYFLSDSVMVEREGTPRLISDENPSSLTLTPILITSVFSQRFVGRSKHQ